MPIVLPLSWIIVAAIVVAALFGATAWGLAGGKRWALLVAWWIVVVCALGVLAGARQVMVWREIGGRPERAASAFEVAIVFAEFFAIALLPPLISLIVRGRRRPDSERIAVATVCGLWAIIGLMLAIGISVAMELFGVPFLQVPGR